MSQLEKVHVLIVDDSSTTRNSISKHLGDAYFTLHAGNGAEAWKLIKSNSSIALVFADLHMPVMNGMVLLKQIRGADNERVANLPVIMITGHEDTDAAKRASYSLGATDFISKPFSSLDIISRAGSYTELSQKISALSQNVSHDSLTGLYNRSGFEDIGEKSIAGSRRYQNELSVLTLQLINIDEILGKHGKKITSQIIVAISKTLKKFLRLDETLAHLGGGRFAVLLPVTSAFKTNIVAMRFQKTVANLAFKTGSAIIRVRLAAGLNSTESYEDKVSFNDLYSDAEAALAVSIQSSSLKVVRYDESHKYDEVFQQGNKLTAVVTSAEPERAKAAVVENRLNATDFKRYISAIFNGNFSQIPEQDLLNMVSPLEAFLAYANQKSELKKARSF